MVVKINIYFLLEILFDFKVSRHTTHNIAEIHLNEYTHVI